MMTPDEQSINTLEDRVTSTKMNDFVTKLSTSLDEIEKTFDRFRHTADQLNTPAVPIMNLPTCRVCGRTNHREDNCYFRQYRSNRQFRPNQPFRGHGNPYRGTFQRQNSYNHGYNQPGYTTPYNNKMSRDHTTTRHVRPCRCPATTQPVDRCSHPTVIAECSRNSQKTELAHSHK